MRVQIWSGGRSSRWRAVCGLGSRGGVHIRGAGDSRGVWRAVCAVQATGRKGGPESVAATCACAVRATEGRRAACACVMWGAEGMHGGRGGGMHVCGVGDRRSGRQSACMAVGSLEAAAEASSSDKPSPLTSTSGCADDMYDLNGANNSPWEGRLPDVAGFSNVRDIDLISFSTLCKRLETHRPSKDARDFSTSPAKSAEFRIQLHTYVPLGQAIASASAQALVHCGNHAYISLQLENVRLKHQMEGMQCGSIHSVVGDALASGSARRQQRLWFG
ncbi:hypothetical protein HETIRDRAFT_426337 [Heterobasidion irregulare TC 32-1]|uniref:Uncharacterized protein n=1 Tax=Heterobasidion irregulare (strain TC 32-1) TaxID=747525 RepID=W4KCP3_HETIT|nr:uncharacterized protein HETIRDRAFT_426337 [Heterobasidion irregulare TC 32-1]ETW82821.1 hypothetical protein HETIRDRAFT_426337 [Heterobasidion irregulare TC 32-1]